MFDKFYSDRIDISNSTVLITGGASGIGYGLSQCFLRSGATVIIVDRYAERLKEAVDQLNVDFNGLKIVHGVYDLEQSNDRQSLFEWIKSKYPETNILINNAGIQQRQSFVKNVDPKTPWNEREKEIQINFCAPIHLANLFLDHFRSMNPTTTAIVNVTSDLAFVPLARFPIYSATKAALHSFTMSLRLELSHEVPSIQVYEIIPPPVQTNLGGSHPFGEPVNEFCQAIFEQLINGKQEIGYKQSERIRQLGSRQQIDEEYTELYERVKTLTFLN